MTSTTDKWYEDRWFLIELFALSNIAFLGLDILIAHWGSNCNCFGAWLPIIFSVIATILLGAQLRRSKDIPEKFSPFDLGMLVGWAAVAIGILGMVFHLQSQLFQVFTIKSLVYSAPFIAPLAFTGVGLLLILNRLVTPGSLEWGKWIIFLALAGFIGNFGLAVLDHAQNGFYSALEWIPAFSSAYAVGILLIPIIWQVSKSYLKICVWVMVLQMGVGALGFVLHLSANMSGGYQNAFENFIHGTPVFAPLLLPNLAILALIGIWHYFTSIETVSD